MRKARVDFIENGSLKFSESGYIVETSVGFVLRVYHGATALGSRTMPCGEWVHEIHFAGHTEPLVVGPDYEHEEKYLSRKEQHEAFMEGLMS